MSTTENLNIIALISGGKDSLYSLLHCIRNGHRIVALANLYPSPVQNTPAQTGQQRGDAAVRVGDDDDGTDEEEDIDSFMYQTIGHSVIPLYEEALGIPLYRQQIVGGVVDEGRIYGDDQDVNVNDPAAAAAAGDETESLLPLLQKIKQAHPEANAVSAGAILSTYQRTRIENVAARLGLVPLAWLWMYPFLPEPALGQSRYSTSSGIREAGLLEDMAAVGCEARIIKVASGGLDEGFLWGDVSEKGSGVRRRIVKGMRPFAGGDVRGAVLGEGGEYETLALDGPGFLWKRRIVVEETVVRREEGGVGYLRLRGARCVDRDSGKEDVSVEDVRKPGLLDGWFGEALEDVLKSSIEDDESVAVTDATARLGLDESRLRCCDAVQTRDGGLWTMSNMTAPEAGPGAAEQMDDIANKATAMLESSGRTTDDIVFATVLLDSMTDFAMVNGVYASLFKKPNPPARATVACGHRLPEGVNVMVSIVVDLGPRALRQGLHVQSRSYWAPANIGPYSQAMSVPLQGAGRLVYVAGQIPLDPASMAIVRPPRSNGWLEDYSLRAVLSLQHLWRIGETMEVDWWLGGIAFLGGKHCTDAKARLAWRLWERMHTRKEGETEEDEEPQLDPWDIKYGGRADEQKPTSTGSSHLPDFEVVESGTSAAIPPFFAVQVEELPRGSDIEWQGLGCQSQKITIAAGEMDHGAWTDTIVGEFTYAGIEIDMAQPAQVSQHLQSVISAYCEHPSISHAVVYTASQLPDAFPGQIVPCSAVWGGGGRRIAAGIIIQRSSPA